MKMVFPHRPASGGPGSFQTRLEKELKKRGWDIFYQGEKESQPDIVFVVGGTRRLFWLLKMKWKRVPILYRLDGINWLHKKKKVGWKKYLTSELQNWLCKFIHAFLADHVVYQSEFVKDWWDRSGWRKRKNVSIIYNGVQVPKNLNSQSGQYGQKRLVILEGSIDYSPYAIQLINELAVDLPEDIGIEIYGKFEDPLNKKKIHSRIKYYGFVKREEVMKILRGSVYLSLDINPACPNTVIEALASGAPVVAFDTGALPELVINGAGILVPYGSNPWNLYYPDVDALAKSITLVQNKYEEYSRNAYLRGKTKYSMSIMTDKYLSIIHDLSYSDKINSH